MANKNKKYKDNTRLRLGRSLRAKHSVTSMSNQYTSALVAMLRSDVACQDLAPVDPRHPQNDNSLKMCMHYHSENQLKVQSLEERAATYYEDIFNSLIQKQATLQDVSVSAKRIFKNAWLDDICINDFISYWCAQTNGKVALFNSAYYSNGQINKKFDSPGIERNALRNADYIICPINHNGHWYLLFLCKLSVSNNKCKYSLYSLDSLNNKIYHSQMWDIGKELLLKIWNEKTDFNLPSHSYPVPIQNNNKDCGAALCYFVERLMLLIKQRREDEVRNGSFLKPYENNSDQYCDYSQYRKQILKTFHSIHCMQWTQQRAPLTYQRSLHNKTLSSLRLNNISNNIIDLTNERKRVCRAK